jgi:xylulokinase
MPQKMYYIGLDLGTTGCKSTVFDEEGNMSGSSYIEYPLIILSDTEIEQDADLWWALSVKAINMALNDGMVDRKMVKAICVSSQGISVVPVDKNTIPLHNAISWLDNRADIEAATIGRCISGDEIYHITGKKLSKNYTAAKILWFKNNLPLLYEKTYKFLLPHDFIVSNLTDGLFITDYTLASGTMLFDIARCCWSEKIVSGIGIDLEKLPQVMASGCCAGLICEKAAKELSLPAGVMIGVGGQDQKVAAFGAGISRTAAALSLGTAGALEFMCDAPVMDAEKRLPCFAHVIPNKWVLEGVISTCGVGLKWLKDTMFSPYTFKEFDDMANHAPLGSGGIRFLPHFAGAASPHWSSKNSASIFGITLNTTKEDIARSILEGLAFEIRENIEVYEHLSKNKILALKVFGGGSYSSVWCNMIADITGIELTTFRNPDIALFGAAKLAFMAGGEQGSLGTQFLNNTKIYKPNQINKQTYDAIYEDYLSRERTCVL